MGIEFGQVVALLRSDSEVLAIGSVMSLIIQVSQLGVVGTVAGDLHFHRVDIATTHHQCEVVEELKTGL